MESKQYILNQGMLILLFLVIILIWPVSLFPENDPHEADVGTQICINCPQSFPQATDPGMCEALVTYNIPANALLIAGLPPDTLFPLGETEIILEDTLTGDTCSFIVTVKDEEAPVITCPDNIIQSYDEGICQVVYFDEPVVSDNCDNDLTITYSSDSGTYSADHGEFGIGMTTVTVRATDDAGNFAECSFTVTITGKGNAALITDGSKSGVAIPQGELEYQRGFFLITPEEMSATQLDNGDIINALGFTIGVAQDTISRGNMMVYLENTDDTISRIDDEWKNIPNQDNPYILSNIAPGEYEWRVGSECPGKIVYSNTSGWEQQHPDSCNQPYNLETNNIGPNAVTLSWECQESRGSPEYLVIYGKPLAQDPDTITTSATTCNISGLEADQRYQWFIIAECGSEDYSSMAASTFQTLAFDNCEDPAYLDTICIGDTVAQVAWAGTPNTIRYEISYKRYGANYWINLSSYDTTYSFTNLDTGTYYKWRVRAICVNNDDTCSGSWVGDSIFKTDGSEVCYAAEGLRSSNINENGVILSWIGTPCADSYEIQYRPKESIPWDAMVVNTMTLVHDGVVSIPAKTGAFNIPFGNANPFIYTGSGLYVAWEYEGTSGLLENGHGSLALCTEKNAVIKDSNGIVVQKLIKSFTGQGYNGTLPDLLKATNLRPETHIGVESMTDIIEVYGVYALGYLAFPYTGSDSIFALVKNLTGDERTVNVSIRVYDRIASTLEYEFSKSLTIPENCGEWIFFDGWLPDKIGSDSIVISIPAQTDEDIVSNNSNYYLQNVNEVWQSYADDSPQINAAGYGEEEGLILSKYSINGCGKVIGAKIYLHYSAQDIPLKAVLLDANGNMLDQSGEKTANKEEVNNYHSFYFPNAPEIDQGEYYIGLAQQAIAGSEYYPVGTQWEGSLTREGAYYRAGLDGSDLEEYDFPGRLMIRAEIIPSDKVPVIEGDELLCEGKSNTLTATSKTHRYADAFIDVGSQYSNFQSGAVQILGTPDVYPEHTASIMAWTGNSANTRQRDHIHLHFPDPGPINFIDVYQTLNPGSIDSIFIKNDNSGEWVNVYDTIIEGPAGNAVREITTEASILEVRLNTLSSFNVSEVLIKLCTDSVPRGIDAVAIGVIENPGNFNPLNWTGPVSGSDAVLVTDQPGVYTLTVTNQDACTLADSIELTSVPHAFPVISYIGQLQKCPGDTVWLISSESENITWNNGYTNDTMMVDTSGTFYVVYNAGCGGDTSASIEVSEFDSPEPDISGGAICPGDSSLLHAGDTYASYVWMYEEDILGSDSSSVYATMAGLYSVEVIDGHGCVGFGDVLAFDVVPRTPTISGEPYFCPGESTILEVEEYYASYLWSSGETTKQITVDTTDVFTVWVTDEHGCKENTSVITGEYVPPQPFITGSLSLCFGSTSVLDAGEGYVAYEWSTGATSSNIVVATADTFSVMVTDVHGCKGSTTVSTNTDGSVPPTPGPISGPTHGICMQPGLEYSIEPVAGAISYLWEVPEGMEILGDSTSTQITVNAGMIDEGIIRVASSNNCANSPTWNGRSLKVHGTPDKPAEISGPASGVCGLSGINYSVPNIYGTSSYNWTVPDGVTITSGIGTSSIMVDFDPAFVTGYISVGVDNACGTSEESQIRVHCDPAMPDTIYGPTEVVQNASGVVYSVDPVFGANNYIWTVPNKAIIVSGQGTTSIIVDFGKKSGDVAVQTENACGLSAKQVLPVIVGGSDAIVLNPDAYNAHDPYQNGSMHAFYPEVIASAGNYASYESVTMNWTLGEPVIKTITDDRRMLTQGFHQSAYEIIALGGIIEGAPFDVEVYPIPTRDNVHIHITSSSDQVNLMVELHDINGNFVYRENVKSKEFNHEINLYKYPAAIFILTVTDLENNFVRKFKIVKIKI